MFIRPMGVTVRPADRPAGRPLLRGLLARAAGAAQDTAGAVGPAEPLAGARPRHPGPAVREPWPAAAAREPEQEPEQEREREPEQEQAQEHSQEQEQEQEQEQAQESAAAVPPSGTGPSAGLVAELTQLAGLAREGLLTPQEFTTAKARLLRG
ncbi:SHOCT domain-containing protein [Streptomyces sp. NPDC097617]|uniref:SHOCT domain-containing protein n=1 Tax=Streptomyces sp. NPDC097617 TaxID=3366091 RepID=UPI00382BC748